MSFWPVVGTVAVVGLFVWLVRGLGELGRLLREAAAEERALAGGSMSWDDRR